MLLLKSTVCKIFTFKYQFQYHSDSTPSSDKVNGFCFLLIRWMASVSFPHSSNVCSGSKFSEQVWNYAKRVDCFTVATNAHVQLLIVITTVKSIHLTVGGSKVAKTHKTTYRYMVWTHLLLFSKFSLTKSSPFCRNSCNREQKIYPCRFCNKFKLVKSLLCGLCFIHCYTTDNGTFFL